MKIENFYNIVDQELEYLISSAREDSLLRKHKSNDQNKGYAFLVWFLQFYGKQSIFRQYITEGNDDNSCDIIFQNTDTQGKKIFYIVQSKWRNVKKKYPRLDKKEFSNTLQDFNVVLNGNLPTSKNENFNRKYVEFRQHLEENGLVKFIFFTADLYEKNNTIETAKQNFEQQQGPNISLDIIDIQRIKRDYIEYKFKQVDTNNPLEFDYNPEEETIPLDIVRYEPNTRDLLEYQGREKAYIFLLAPKTIHALFQRFKFSLFFQNVRNPLIHSNYNPQIVDTLINKPNAFWYFNNGITAITQLVPNIGKQAKKVEVQGLQVINGAQTVYSIYSAYEQANTAQRKIMDAEVRVTFRLIKSNDEAFNLEITRYTNSQNPMELRDFVANDPVQKRLQQESFETNYWYETRRGEFRPVEQGDIKQTNVTIKEELRKLKIVQNVDLIKPYAAFYLQNLSLASQKDSLLLASHTVHIDGQYERIFNNTISFEKMLTAYLLHTFLVKRFEWSKGYGNTQAPLETTLISIRQLTVLAFSKIVFDQYFQLKFGRSTQTADLLIPLQQEDITKQITILQVLSFSNDFIHDITSKISLENINRIDEFEHLIKKIENGSIHQKAVEEFEESNFKLEDIDSIRFNNNPSTK